jgi:predicted phosphodiesterase
VGNKRALILSDVHCPYHDEKLINKIYSLVRRESFDSIYILGDFLDCVSISKFSKEPDRYDYLDEEISEGVMILSKLRLAGPDSRIYFMPGNHELRLQKFLWTRARPLAKLKSLQLDELLQANKLGIVYLNDNIVHLNSTFVLKHGTKCGEAPARGELMSMGISGLSGHAHKSNTARKNYFDRACTWYSVGHLCDVSQITYARDFAYTWNQGIAVIEYNQTQVNVTEIEPIGGKFFYNGVQY